MMPKTASSRRQERAENITILESRRISEEVWEVDVINEDGHERENLTIIPNRIYSPTKDMQHRGPKGIVGKYIRALAMHDDEARSKLTTAIKERRERIQGEISDLKEEESNLLHAQADLEE